jgi:membrane carboxypeptidase/penicillin-binding protein PbpC
MPAEIARTISDILNDNDARTPAYGRNSTLYFPNHDVAVKTGTTNDYKDAWTIGFTPNFVLGIWAGNNDNTPMEKKVAGQIVAPVWNEVMKYIIATYPQESFKKPTADYSDLKPIFQGVWQGGRTYVVDNISGKLATEFTPEETKQTKVIGEVHSILYWIDKKDPYGPKLVDPAQDAQFNNWETPVRKWALENGYLDQNDSVIPTKSDDIHTQGNAPIVSINGIKNDAYNLQTPLSFNIFSSGRYPAQKAYVYINGDLINTLTSLPFSVTVNLDSVVSIKENNELRVVVYDQVFNKTERVINFNVSVN